MLIKQEDKTKEVTMVSIEMLVPQDHLLRKINKAIDFEEIRDLVEKNYSKEKGRPSVDPVMLVKIVFLQHLCGIRSLRQTVKEIEVNVAYRWFLNLGMLDKVPHFSTVSKAFVKRFTEEQVDQIFEWVLMEACEKGFVDEQMVFIDGTHVKANANRNKTIRKKISIQAKSYEKALFEEVNQDREEHGKKPFDDNSSSPPAEKEVTASTTDPDSGLFVKGEHERAFTYNAHVGCDRNNFVLECVVKPGNVHDSVVFPELYEKITQKFPETETVVCDAGYKTAAICKEVIDDGRNISLPYKRPLGKKGFYRPNDFVYDEYYDCVICPRNEVLSYSTTNRDGRKVFKSCPSKCANCPDLSKCTQNKKHVKTIEVHLWKDYLEQAEDFRHSPEGAYSYGLRSQTIERVFADGKVKHGLRFTFHKGLGQVTKWLRLKFAAMNLKKMALWSA